MLPLRRIALLVIAPVVIAGLTASPAMADKKPGFYKAWPVCGQGNDTDGQFCVVSLTRNGEEVPPVDTATHGEYFKSRVQLVDTGTLIFDVDKTVVNEWGAYDDPDLDPADTFALTVNTGAINPRELWGSLRDVSYSVHGGPTTGGYVFTVGTRSAPISQIFQLSDGALQCTTQGCGDSSTAAEYERNVITGSVTDDANAGWNATQVARRTGYFDASNAQDYLVGVSIEDIDIRTGNAALQSDGSTPFDGYVQAFLPDTMLQGTLGIVDPAALTAESFTITHPGTGAAPDATVTREEGGIRIEILGVTGPTTRTVLTPVPTVPGAVRSAKFTRPTATSAKVTFKAPLADGTSDIGKYQAACRKGTGSWRQVGRSASPITITQLPKGALICQVRAVNDVGAGPWVLAKAP